MLPRWIQGNMIFCLRLIKGIYFWDDKEIYLFEVKVRLFLPGLVLTIIPQFNTIFGAKLYPTYPIFIKLTQNLLSYLPNFCPIYAENEIWKISRPLIKI